MQELVKFPLLELLPEAEKQTVLSGLKMQKFDVGETIHDRDERSDVFFIFEGKIRIDMQDQHGEFAFFDYRYPGSFIGWFSALTDLPQPVTTTAMQKSLLGRMPGPAFMGMILARREVCAYMLRMMAERLISDTRRISNLIVLDALRRVAAEILERANGTPVAQVPARVDWAARLGMTRPTLAKQLSELRRRGCIRIDGNNIKILDAQQLANLVG